MRSTNGFLLNNIGNSGQHLVMSELLANNINSFLSESGGSYDILFEHDSSFIKLEVKTVKTQIKERKYPIYGFSLDKRKKKSTRYIKKVDGYALVVLDIKKIAFMPADKGLKTNIYLLTRNFGYSFNATNCKYKYIEDLTLNKFIKHLKEKK